MHILFDWLHEMAGMAYPGIWRRTKPATAANTHGWRRGAADYGANGSTIRESFCSDHKFGVKGGAPGDMIRNPRTEPAFEAGASFR
jgi:hypothetical protein